MRIWQVIKNTRSFFRLGRRLQHSRGLSLMQGDTSIPMEVVWVSAKAPADSTESTILFQATALYLVFSLILSAACLHRFVWIFFLRKTPSKAFGKIIFLNDCLCVEEINTKHMKISTRKCTHRKISIYTEP